MTQATSTHFVAYLAEATAEVEARLLQWASCCVEHSWVRDDKNRASLHFARAESRTTRQMQSLLRTLTSRWGLPLGKLEAGWLQPLTVDEYRAAVSVTGTAESAVPAPNTRCRATYGERHRPVAAQHACTAAVAGPRGHAEPSQNAEHTTIPQHHAGPCAEAAAQLAHGAGVVLHELSPDFDRRSQEMYQRMLIAQAAH